MYKKCWLSAYAGEAHRLLVWAIWWVGLWRRGQERNRFSEHIKKTILSMFKPRFVWGVNVEMPGKYQELNMYKLLLRGDIWVGNTNLEVISIKWCQKVLGIDEIPKRRLYGEVEIKLRFEPWVILRWRFGWRGKVIEEDRKEPIRLEDIQENVVSKNKKCFKTFQLCQISQAGWKHRTHHWPLDLGKWGSPEALSRKYQRSGGHRRQIRVCWKNKEGRQEKKPILTFPVNRGWISQ